MIMICSEDLHKYGIVIYLFKLKHTPLLILNEKGGLLVKYTSHFLSKK